MTADLHDRIARANPVPAPTKTPPDADLLRGILATPLAPPRGRSRARYLAVGAVVAGAAAVLVATLLPGERLGPSPAAAQALERLAVAAAAQPSPAGRWAYTRARTLYAGTNTEDPPYSVLFPAVRESWVAADGAARIVESPGKPIFLSESDRRRWEAEGGRMEAGRRTDRRYRSLPLSHALYADVAGLPTEPNALEAELRRRVETQNPPPEDGYSIAGELRSQISSLLHSPASSGELRAALYRVLARLPGVELVGDIVDPAGRNGIGLKSVGGYGDEADPTSRLLIVDPVTGDILAEQSIIERRVEWIDADPGEVYGEIVYFEHGWTDSIEERP
jgi:hypothetical protein